MAESQRTSEKNMIFMNGKDKLLIYDIFDNALSDYPNLCMSDSGCILKMVRLSFYNDDMLFVLTNNRLLHQISLSKEPRCKTIPISFEPYELLDGLDENLRESLYAISQNGSIYKYSFKLEKDGTCLNELQPNLIGCINGLEECSIVRMFQREGVWYCFMYNEPKQQVVWRTYDCMFTLIEEFDISENLQACVEKKIVDILLRGCQLIIATEHFIYIFDIIQQKPLQTLQFLDGEKLLSICLHYTKNYILQVFAAVQMGDKMHLVAMNIDGERIQNITLDSTIFQADAFGMWSYRDLRYNICIPSPAFCFPTYLYDDFLKSSFTYLSQHANAMSTAYSKTYPINLEYPKKYTMLTQSYTNQLCIQASHDTAEFALYEPSLVEEGLCTKTIIMKDANETERQKHRSIFYEVVDPECWDGTLSFKLYYNKTLRDISFILDSPALIKAFACSKSQGIHFNDVCLIGKVRKLLSRVKHASEKV